MHPLLAPYVESAVAYELDGLCPGVHHGLPSGTLTFIVPVGDPLRTAVDRAAWHRGDVRDHDVVLGGVHTRATYVEQPSRMAGLQYALDPLGARVLLGMPAAELPCDEFDAVDVLGADALRLRARVEDAATWAQRHRLVEEFWLRRLSTYENRAGVRPEVAAAWTRIRERGGNVRVGDLAREVALGPRQLTREFLAETGTTPRTAIRLARFGRARAMLQRRAVRREPLDIAAVAHRAGYYDHAHLVRDFREFSDLPPTGWTEEVANIQAGRTLGAAS